MHVLRIRLLWCYLVLILDRHSEYNVRARLKMCISKITIGFKNAFDLTKCLKQINYRDNFTRAQLFLNYLLIEVSWTCYKYPLDLFLDSWSRYGYQQENLTEKSSMASDSKEIMIPGEQTNPDPTFGKSMVLILDGNLEIGENVRSNLGYSISWRHLIVSRAGTNQIFFLQEDLFFLHDCTTCSELTYSTKVHKYHRKNWFSAFSPTDLQLCRQSAVTRLLHGYLHGIQLMQAIKKYHNNKKVI